MQLPAVQGPAVQLPAVQGPAVQLPAVQLPQEPRGCYHALAGAPQIHRGGREGVQGGPWIGAGPAV